MLVGRYALEDNEVLLYDRSSGRSVSLAELPKFSPTGDRLFVRDIPYGSESEGDLEVWRREGETAILESSQHIPKIRVPHPDYPINATVEVVDWRDNGIDLTLSTAAPEHHWPGRLSLEQGVWTLTQTPPAELVSLPAKTSDE